MKLQFARRPDRKWAVFDEEEQSFRLDGATTEEVIAWFAQHTTRLLKAWLASPPPQMTYNEMRVRAGQIRCEVCDKVVNVEAYRPQLSERRQRCVNCCVQSAAGK